MERIECLRAHEVCELDGEMYVPGPFDSAAPLALDASSLSHQSRLCREVHECDDGQPFAAHRARLLGIAHRMLGSRAEAEDVVQDVYLRWHQSVRGDIESPIAFLVTITTRLCLDRLRELKRQHTEYLDPWTSDYVIEDHMPSPEVQLEFSEEVSMAFLAVLERLGPEERAAFLLHDVLDYDYKEMGKMLGKTESACRQVIHRARERVRDSRARFALTRASCEGVVTKFLAAIGAGDREAVIALLAEELECMAVWINTHFLFDWHDASLAARQDKARSGTDDLNHEHVDEPARCANAGSIHHAFRGGGTRAGVSVRRARRLTVHPVTTRLAEPSCNQETANAVSTTTNLKRQAANSNEHGHWQGHEATRAFRRRCISPRLLDGHHRTDFECGVAGSGFGPIEADESFFQLS